MTETLIHTERVARTKAWRTEEESSGWYDPNRAGSVSNGAWVVVRVRLGVESLSYIHSKGHQGHQQCLAKP